MIALNAVCRVALCAGCILLAQANAVAAPQMLGLVATLSPTPLLCRDGTCKAEFSSFCLQKERDVPQSPWQYEVADGGSLQLVLTDAQGRERRIAAVGHVTIRVPRGFTAVEISIPSTTLVTLGAHMVAIDVGQKVSLAPVARPGDDNPITSQERLLAAGPLRQVGSGVVDQDAEVLATTRVLNRLINGLPETVLVGEGAVEALWNRALASGLATHDAGQQRIARSVYDACWKNAPVAFGVETVRHCVQDRHDSVMLRKNRVYWKSVEAGS